MKGNQKQIIANKILEVERKNDGWLLNGYQNEKDFITDLMKEESFKDVLEYYYNIRKISNTQKAYDIATEAITVIESMTDTTLY